VHSCWCISFILVECIGMNSNLFSNSIGLGLSLEKKREGNKRANLEPSPTRPTSLSLPLSQPSRPLPSFLSLSPSPALAALSPVGPAHATSPSLSPRAHCGRTNLNYTSSSTRVHFRGLQRASNGIIPWPVG
jgi:hypothetical protein